MNKLTPLQLAKRLYTAYCREVGNVAFNGDALPSADVFFNDPSKVKQAQGWVNAADVAFELILNGSAS